MGGCSFFWVVILVLRVIVLVNTRAFNLLLKVISSHDLVTFGLKVQQFVAFEVWKEYTAQVSHRGADIVSERHGAVEVKYFTWSEPLFLRALRGALTQYKGEISCLVLVSIVLFFPKRRVSTTSRKPFYMRLEEAVLGVVIGEMSEVTEEVDAGRTWREFVREAQRQMPEHEIVGLDPDEVFLAFQMYLLQKYREEQKKVARTQEELKKKQDELKQSQEELKKTLKKKQDELKQSQEELKKTLKKKQDELERRQEELSFQLKELSKDQKQFQQIVENNFTELRGMITDLIQLLKKKE